MQLLKLLSGAVALLAAAVVAAPAKHQPYAGHQLVRVNVSPNAPDQTVQQLHKALEAQHLDVWDVQRDHIDVRLPAGLKSIHDAPHISALLKSGSADATVLHSNIQQIVDAERARLSKPEAATAPFFSDYQPYDKIVAWYQDLAKANPTLVTFVPSIGQTVNGVDIFAIRITSPNASPTPKKQFFFQGLIHAREWISGTTAAYLANQLVADYAKDATLLNAAEFVFIPVVNPDGYKYTWTDERLWRKNLGANGQGVDLNRNYDDGHWAKGGSSNDPSDETYHGPSAASEPETQAVQNYFLAQKNLVGALDLHSYSQLVLRPYGYTRSAAPDETLNKKLGDGIAAAIKKNSKKTYSSIKSIDLYVTTGTSTDFWYKNRRIYSFTIELRPTDGGSSGDGFVLDPSQILPTGQEIYAAVTYWVNAALASPLPSSQKSQ